MLTATVVLEISRLLGEGTLSQRKIAEELRVSRGIVGAIASGTRGLHGRQIEAGNKIEFRLYRGRPERCNECGGFVYKPCIACQIRAYQRKIALKGRAYLPLKRVA